MPKHSEFYAPFSTLPIGAKKMGNQTTSSGPSVRRRGPRPQPRAVAISKPLLDRNESSLRGLRLQKNPHQKKDDSK